MSPRPVVGRPRPWRDIVLAVLLKFALLIVLYVAFFSPSHRAPADIAGHVFNVGPIETTARK
jgi:hypothetical protein